MLAIFASPVYAIAAVLQVRWLRRHRARFALWTAALSAGIALPLTVALWVGFGKLPEALTTPIWRAILPTGGLAIVALVAAVASATVFPVVALFVRRRFVPPAV